MDLTSLSPLLAAAAFTATACSTPENDDNPFGAGLVTSATDSSSGAGSTGDAPDEPGETGGGPKLDVSAPETDGQAGDEGGGDQGCTKVDFLFVIDASPSMDAEQTQLLASFPGFIDSIRSTVAAQDYHILVTDVDSVPQYTPVGDNEFCDDDSCCGPTCSADQMGNWCNNNPCGDHSGDCDFTLGAGKDDDENWSTCPMPQDRRWLDGSDPNLLESFQCVARVGTYGHYDETQAAAIVSALQPDEAQGCNAGFLRDDAVLVVTLITDEEDQSSPGEPQDWHDQIMALKGNNPDAVVMLGLVGDYGQPGSPCLPFDPEGTGAHDAARMRSLVSAFGDRGLIGSVCANDYVPFFQNAVDLIADACDDFTPVG